MGALCVDIYGKATVNLIVMFWGPLLVSCLVHHSVTPRRCLFFACLSCPFRFLRSWPYHMSCGTCRTLLRYWLRQSRPTRGSSNFAGEGFLSRDRMLQCWLWGEHIGPRVPQNLWHRLKIFSLWEWKIFNILQEQPTKIAVPWTCKIYHSSVRGFY